MSTREISIIFCMCVCCLILWYLFVKFTTYSAILKPYALVSFTGIQLQLYIVCTSICSLYHTGSVEYVVLSLQFAMRYCVVCM